MKKILIFSLAYYPHVGGAEIAIKEITDRISDIEFHIVTLRFSSADARNERMGNVMVHRVGFGLTYSSKIFFVPLAVFRAVRLNRKHHFDAAWAMMSYMLFPVVLLRVLGVRLPYALTLQEGDTYKHTFQRLRTFLFLPFLSFGFRKAGVVQAISVYLGEWARRRGFRGRLEIIPNGVDTQKFARLTEHVAVRKALNIRENETVLITTSRLVNKNAVDDVLRALPELPGTHFLVLGDGPEEVALKKLARDLGVANRVRFMDYVVHKELPAYLQASTIFVRPSRSEGMGSSFIEAMAAGIPVIATQEGGIADFLYDANKNPDKEPTGFAVEKDSPEQVAQAVRDILENQEQTKRVVENARKLVFEKYDWNLIARNMHEKVFSKVL